MGVFCEPQDKYHGIAWFSLCLSAFYGLRHERRTRWDFPWNCEEAPVRAIRWHASSWILGIKLWTNWIKQSYVLLQKYQVVFFCVFLLNQQIASLTVMRTQHRHSSLPLDHSSDIHSKTLTKHLVLIWWRHNRYLFGANTKEPNAERFAKKIIDFSKKV